MIATLIATFNLAFSSLASEIKKSDKMSASAPASNNSGAPEVTPLALLPVYLALVATSRRNCVSIPSSQQVPQVLHRLQNKEKPMQTTFTLRFGSLKMIFECSIARCDVGLGRAIVQCQKNPLRKPKLSINRAILSAHFSAVKFCIGFFCWIGFFWFCIGFFCNWMLQLLLKIVAKNLNYASLHVCT